MKWPWSKKIKRVVSVDTIICSKCGERVTAGVNHEGKTFHLKCKPDN